MSKTLPIIVAAFNDETVIEASLRSFQIAARSFCQQVAATRVLVIVCDNGSTDSTRAMVQTCAQSLQAPQFEIVLIQQPLRGKVMALRAAIQHLKEGSLHFGGVVFADADVLWTEQTLAELWRYWESVHHKADLVGARIQRDSSKPENIWEALEGIHYAGYGEGHQGHGLFVRFVSGMTYVCSPRGDSIERRSSANSPFPRR